MARMHALHREVIRLLLERHLAPSRVATMIEEPSFILGLHERLDPILCGEQPDLLSLDELGTLVRAAWDRTRGRTLRPGVDTPTIQRLRFHGELERGRLPAFLGLSSPAIELPGGPVSLFQSRRS